MNGKFKTLSLVSVLVVFAAIFAFSGCSNNAPLAPDTEQINPLDRLIGGYSAGELETVQLAEVDKYISSDRGGEIVIESGELEHKFEVPAGAIPKDTLISVVATKEEVNAKSAVVFEFGPAGLEFDPAAELEFDIADLNPDLDKASLYYYNPDRRRWELQEIKSVEDGKVEFKIHHFSKYAISD